MLSKTLEYNKRLYLDYNNFRKQIFTELAPKDSETILYLLPWLMSINNPAFPGYVKGLKKPFTVYNINLEKEIIKREPAFKKLFNFKGRASLLNLSLESCCIQGIYTIGSVGTASQTSHSDCDLWVCIDKRGFEETMLTQFNQKINLIKDWLDANLKIPVYFFISDINDIKSCNFGNVDCESSGSAQGNVLKEEFYRTSIRICGKIPLWWICFDKSETVEYEEVVRGLSAGDIDGYDIIDLGNLELVNNEEYFGAALWQYNKSLTHPLKSIIKMLLLKMLLELPKEELLCHKFRRAILGKGHDQSFTDPSLFTMNAVLDYSKGFDKETFEFIKKCFYLRYEIKLYTRQPGFKEKFAGELFRNFQLDPDEIRHLNDFASWSFNEQTQIGARMFTLLLKIYTDIAAIGQGITGKIAPQDLTIIGRKLSSCLQKKPAKIPILPKPTENLNLPSLTFRTNGKIWRVHSSIHGTEPITSAADIVHCIAFLVWNDIYLQPLIRMMPNATSVTLQEIINLAKKIKDVFGIFDITGIDFENFMAEEKIIKMLLVVSFEAAPDYKNINDFCLLYENNWGEFFVNRFNSPDKLSAFMVKNRKHLAWKEMNYYIQRNSLYYEKIIERTKRLVSQIIYS